MSKEKNDILDEIRLIRGEIAKPECDRRRLNELIDSFLNRQSKLLDAKQIQLSMANGQINDLIALMKDRARLIRQMQSRIEYVDNHPAYKLYSKTVGQLKNLLGKK